ncbi:TIGR03086 family metal-binding protein [Nocardia sp. NPDC005366]|uniref:TIGR03086 family metal-binding protein n=1 Tax=Nocardia sp. NPDC005366 TaxID=3156878 RepID=UPI0033BAEA5E
MTITTAPLTTVWRTVLDESYRALENAVARVDADQWRLPTPCSEWNVAQVVQHAAGDQLGFAAALGFGAGPAYNPFEPSGDIEGAPLDLVRAALEPAVLAWSTVTDETPTVPTPLPHGELPTPVAAVMCALDAAVHAWDIAVATGNPSPLTDELAGRLLTAARTVNPAPGGGPSMEIVEPLRQWGAYSAVVDGEPDDGAVEQLLRYLGRDPRA